MTETAATAAAAATGGADAAAGDAASVPHDRIRPATRRGRYAVVGVLALALVVRVLIATEVSGDYIPQNDALHYDFIATSIANGDGYGDAILPPAQGPSAFRAPLYPTSLAAVYAVFGGHNWRAGLMAQTLIGVGVVALVGLVAAQIWGRRTAFAALCIAAVHPALVLTGSSLQHEPLLVVLTLGAVASALQYGRDPRLRWAAGAGALLGLAGLTRELGLLAAPPIAVLLWQYRPAGTPRFRARALAAPALAAICAVVVIAPWTVRNAVRFDAFVPISTSSGFGLVGTFNEAAVENASVSRGEWVRPYDAPDVAEVMSADEAPDEADLDADLRSHALGIIVDNPGYLLDVVYGNTLRLLDLDGGGYNRDVVARFNPYPLWLMNAAIYGSSVVLVLAVYGATQRAAGRCPFAVWAIPLVTLAFMLLLLPANIRYRASLEPFVILLAAVAVIDVANHIRRLRRSHRLLNISA